MGEFNMSRFQVVPEIRCRGAVIDLGAWFSEQPLAGEPMIDSCGILFLNLTGEHALIKNVGDIHGNDPTGVLFHADRAQSVDEAYASSGSAEISDVREDDSAKRLPILNRMNEKAGPGMRLTTFLPKHLDLRAKCRESLTPFE